MFQSIVVAIKRTPASETALQVALDMVKSCGGHLHIFHALDYQLKEDPDAPEAHAARHDAENWVRGQLGAENASAEHVHIDCYPADPGIEVSAYARKRAADIILLGCHQRMKGPSLGRVDLTAMNVFERSHCPVMLIPHRHE